MILLIIGPVLLAAGIPLYSLFTADRVVEYYVPLTDAAMEIELEAALGHLWFEEAVTEDSGADIAAAWNHLDQSVWYAQAMLEGGENPQGVIVPLDDPELRREIENVLAKLAAFRAIAEKRWAMRAQSGIGSEIDQRFDAVFEDFLDQADRVEAALRDAMSRYLARIRTLQGFLIAFVLAMGVFATIVIRRYERRQASDTVELLASEEKFRLMFETSPLGMVLCEMDGTFVQANRAYLDIIGYSHEEALKLSYWDVTPREYDENEAEQLRSMKETGRYGPYEKEYVRKTGERVPVLLNGMVVKEADGVERIWSIVEDITERKQAEEELHRYERIVSSTTDMLALRDRDHVYLAANAAYAQAFTKTPDEMIGRTPAEVFGDDVFYTVIRPMAERCLAGESVRYRDWFDFPATGRRYMDVAYAPHLGPGTEVRGYVVTARDVTDAKRAEEQRLSLERQMQHAQKLESLGVLAGGIAHDFNNLLMTILGNADLALFELSPYAPARENIEEIEKASKQAAELAKQMLAYSGKGRFVIKPIDLREIVEEMAHLLKVSISKKATLKYNFADNLPPIDGDATQIRQIIMNLITNASEAIGDNVGVISLSTGTMECDRAYLDGGYEILRTGLDEPLPEGRYVYLEVSDTGCGMDNEAIEKVFDPFFTTKFAGRGLGLAAVLGIVRGHHGTINIYSELGKGTTFKILFPASELPVSDDAIQKQNGSKAATWRGRGTILLADDEKSVFDVGKKMLNKMGFSVLTATDGREAVEVFRKHADQIDCVLLDLTMPHMDGEQAFRELRRIRPDVKVILSSGYNEQDATQHFGAKGLAGFIQKPYVMATLRAKLMEVLPGDKAGEVA